MQRSKLVFGTGWDSTSDSLKQSEEATTNEEVTELLSDLLELSDSTEMHTKLDALATYIIAQQQLQSDLRSEISSLRSQITMLESEKSLMRDKNIEMLQKNDDTHEERAKQIETKYRSMEKEVRFAQSLQIDLYSKMYSDPPISLDKMDLDRYTRMWSTLTQILKPFRVFSPEVSTAMLENLKRLINDNFIKEERMHSKWMTSIVIRCEFRRLFGVDAMKRCGFFIDKQVSCMVDEYAYWVEYPTGDLTLIEHSGSVYSAAITADGRHLFTSGKDTKIVCWDLSNHNSRMVKKSWVAHFESVWSLCLRRHLLVSSSSDGSIKIWHCHTHELLRTLIGHIGQVRCVQINHDCTSILSCSSDMSIREWSVSTGECRRVLKGHRNHVRCVRYIGDSMISGADDRSLKTWGNDTIECEQTIEEDISNDVWGLSVNCNQTVIGCACLFSSTVLFSWPGLEKLGSIHRGNLTLEFHPFHPHILAVGMQDHSVQVYSVLECTKAILNFKGHTNYVRDLCFTPDCSRLVSVSQDTSVRVWDVSRLPEMMQRGSHTKREI